jgi:hypothetical protein
MVAAAAAAAAFYFIGHHHVKLYAMAMVVVSSVNERKALDPAMIWISQGT